jgi:dihydrofolate reductase
MKTSIIVAKSNNNVIGKDGGLPWSVPADERYFLDKIKEGCLLTGRKSYESNQGSIIFEDRSFVLITRREDYQAGPGGTVAHSVEAGIQVAKERGTNQLWILGGGEIYKQALPHTDELYVTEIHTHVKDGDAFFPEIDPDVWEEDWRESHPADEENEYAYTFVHYCRKDSTKS